MILTENELRVLIRNLLFEDVLGEPDQSREEQRDDEKKKDKEDDDDEETLTDTSTKDEVATVGGMGAGLGPMTPVGTDAYYPSAGSPSDYLQGKKKKKKKKKKSKK